MIAIESCRFESYELGLNIRRDRWANEHRVQVEVGNNIDERGYYITPDVYGFGKDRGITYKHQLANE